MKHIFTILLLAAVVILACNAVFTQSRTNRLVRPCPATATPAKVEILRAGDIEIVPCSGRSITVDGPGSFDSLKLLDPTFTPHIPTARNWFSIGSPDFIASTNHVYPDIVDLRWDHTGATAKSIIGRLTRISNIAGTGVSNNYIGSQTFIANNTDDSGTGNMYGYYAFLNVEHQINEGVGFTASVGIGSGFAGTLTNQLKGIHAVVSTSHNGGSSQLNVAGDFQIRNATGGVNVVPDSYMLRAYANNLAGHTLTNLTGLGFTGWTNAGAVTNSYGIYADASIDVGSTSRYFIYSESTSPSFLTAPINFDATITPGGTTGNQTINKPQGTVNIAPAADAATVTNSFVNANSIVLPVVRTLDATCTSARVVPAAGSFTVTMDAACTAETSIGFVVHE